uniref:Molybdopterin synthase n=1 Tax=Angiostrongylus cantonensis TaxID=6313 RepID=A0A0K0D993_ANGCA
LFFHTLNESTCRRRRSKRTYDPPDVPGYFEEVVWPAYQQHLQKALALAREDCYISFLDVTLYTDQPDEKMVSVQKFCFVEKCIEFSTISCRFNFSPTCGATSVFVGTTRDTFNGRSVARLDYETYDEMAYKELRKLCSLIRSKYPSVERVVIFHRLGYKVAVGETSVIIATASPHRKDALHATEMAIDELKRAVPIWKKVSYSNVLSHS